jgi:hypothetical protein
MRKHFLGRHCNDSVIVEEEGYLRPCPRCGLQNGDQRAHAGTKQCDTFYQQRLKREEEQIQIGSKNIRFKIGEQEIEMVRVFKYLGRMVRDDDKDTLALKHNLKKAQGTWARLRKSLCHDNTNWKTMGYFYKAVIMTVLLYSAETWTLSQADMSRLRNFHYRVAMGICGLYPRKVGEEVQPDGRIREIWDWPRTETVLNNCGLETIDVYLQRRKDKMMEWVKEQLPEQYEQCTTSTPKHLNWKQRVWWEEPEYDNDNDENMEYNNNINNNNNGDNNDNVTT